jgi:MYXO-CTERM domain-containing protein
LRPWKISVLVVAVLAASAMPCAATPKGGGSFLDHARLGAAHDRYRGAFSSAGSFRFGAAGGDHFTAPPPAVPAAEPEPYAMLLAVLGLLGFIARRRSRALSAAD